MKRAIPYLVFLFFLGGTGAFQWYIYQKQKSTDFLLDQIFLLPNQEAMQYIGAGYEATIVDMLWIRAIQYYGQHFSSLCKQPEKGEGLVDLFHTIVTLEPDFKHGYKWAAFVLTESMNDPEKCPGGARRAIEEFLKPAIERFPDDPSFAAEAGFTAFWHLQDNDLAVKMFERAAAVPGAPPNLERMIPYVRSSEDSFESLGFAFERYRDIFVRSTNEGEKHIADNHLRRIMTRYHLLHLNRAAKKYRERTDQSLQNLAELAAAGVLNQLVVSEWEWGGITEEDLATGTVAKEYENGIPVSPEGYHYVYVPGEDEVAILEERQERQDALIGFLNNRLTAYQEKYGRCPANLEEMVPEYLKTVPPDPLGMNLSIDPVDCVIVVEVP